MNKDRILELASAIENTAMPDIHFYMGFFYQRTTPEQKEVYGTDCGTVACIAGHAAALFAPETVSTASASVEAREYLDLDGDTAQELFIPMNGAITSHDRKLAANVLRILAETGRVDWEEAERITQCQKETSHE